MNTTTTTSTPPTVRYRSAGPRDVPTDLIEQEAMAAAKEARSLVDACPYPFSSEAGLHFAAVWYLHTDPTEATVSSRPPAVAPKWASGGLLEAPIDLSQGKNNLLDLLIDIKR